jgi:hypothetical protein
MGEALCQKLRLSGNEPGLTMYFSGRLFFLGALSWKPAAHLSLFSTPVNGFPSLFFASSARLPPALRIAMPPLLPGSTQFPHSATTVMLGLRASRVS